ncbi:efflux RND transporter periplasmic adaptor subunit [Motilimonas eburnea]|uniref:efflux RND transporter periplasmic adaptor subunit n=1 Tax=Motilimonas eburnea TaxID=1737488 RepID=UPI002551DD56|nr:efflux RND transporter periplasmic adaptor subunit [Motilimonas eburnea]
MNKTRLAVMVLSLSVSLLLTGCERAETGNPGANLPVVQTQQTEVINYYFSKSYVGRVEAVEDTNITAQVSGYLKQRHFEEGQIVNQGDLLYSIEPSSFVAEVASGKAALAQANAALSKAQNDHRRGKNLLPRGSISQSEFDALTAQLLGAQAQVEAAKAQLNLAEVNLSYTEIRAPFTGRISSSKISQGDLVSPSLGVLTTLVSLDPVHATFNMSERERLALNLDKLSGNTSQASQGAKVYLVLENGQQFEHPGQLDFINNRIDIQTGTIQMRAQIPNPEQTLLPGQHVIVKLQQAEASEVVVVPRRAVQSDLGGDFVMLVVEGNVAERRNVKIGEQIDSQVIISDGLAPGDEVISQGLQRVRNGIPVSVQNSTELAQ